MNALQPARLIASAVLVAGGAVATAISEPRGGIGFFVGVGLLIVGLVFMVIEWRRPKNLPTTDDDETAERSVETGIRETNDY